MAGIVTRTLEVKNVYDNMAESARPVFFKISDQGKKWSVCGLTRMDVECEEKFGWIFLYGKDPQNSCELVFTPDENTGEPVLAECTVWNELDQRTYHRFFKNF